MGEWLSNNIVGIIVAIAGWLGTIIAVAWMLSGIASQSKSNGKQMETLAQAFKDHENDFDKHTSDSTVHTTFEYRQAINQRLDRIEDTVNEGHKTIEGKIDRVMDRLMNNHKP